MAANIVRDNADLASPFLVPQVFEDDQSGLASKRCRSALSRVSFPWNAPIILTMRKLAPALACGNTIVLKPAPSGAMGLSILLKKMALSFRLASSNVLHGGPEVGRALSTHQKVRKVSFTGGGKVAREIMKSAAATIKKAYSSNWAATIRPSCLKMPI